MSFVDFPSFFPELTKSTIFKCAYTLKKNFAESTKPHFSFSWEKSMNGFRKTPRIIRILQTKHNLHVNTLHVMHVQDMRASNSLILFLQPPQTRPLVIGSRQARGLIHGRNTNPLTQRLPSPPPPSPAPPLLTTKAAFSGAEPIHTFLRRLLHINGAESLHNGPNTFSRPLIRIFVVPNNYTSDRIQYAFSPPSPTSLYDVDANEQRVSSRSS